MKLNKILSTSLLTGVLCLTTNVNAEDFNFTLKELVDVDALGIAQYGNQVISVRGFDIDPIYGPYFNTINIAGDEISFNQFVEGLNELFDAPDNEQLNINDIEVTTGKLKDLFNNLFNELFEEPKVIAALEMQGVPEEKITQLKNSTFTQKIEFIGQVQEVSKKVQQVNLLEKIALPVMNLAMNQLGNAIDTRSDMFNQNEAFGISSGAEKGRGFGAWIKGMAAKEDYKASGNKYKAKTYSGIAGFDFKAMDQLIIGLAGGYQQREFSKEKIKFHNAIGSIYSSYQFDNNIFTDLKYIFGRGIITNKKNNLAFKAVNTNHQADAKVGCNFLVNENTLLTPTVGVRYNFQKLKLKDNAFSSNYSAKAKDGNYSHAIVGLKLAYKIDSERGALIPFIKVGYENLMSNKKTKINLTNKRTNVTSSVKFDNTEKHTFLAGAGIGAALNNVDLGAEYTFSKSKLYKGHTGTLALRVNF